MARTWWRPPVTWRNRLSWIGEKRRRRFLAEIPSGDLEENDVMASSSFRNNRGGGTGAARGDDRAGPASVGKRTLVEALAPSAPAPAREELPGGRGRASSPRIRTVAKFLLRTPLRRQ